MFKIFTNLFKSMFQMTLAVLDLLSRNCKSVHITVTARLYGELRVLTRAQIRNSTLIPTSSRREAASSDYFSLI